MLKQKRRKVANLRHYLSQLESLRTLGVLEKQLGKSLNQVIKKYDLFESNYRMNELSALWKQYGSDTENVIQSQLAILEQEEKELSLLIERAMEIYIKKDKLPSVGALLSELGFEGKSRTYKSDLSSHLRMLVATTLQPQIIFESQRGSEVKEELMLEFADPKFGRVSRKLIACKIQALGFLVSKPELTKFSRFINQNGRAPRVRTYFTVNAQENAAINQVAEALNVTSGVAVSVMIRGVLHLMASQKINAVGFLEQSKNFGPTDLSFISKFFSKVSI